MTKYYWPVFIGTIVSAACIAFFLKKVFVGMSPELIMAGCCVYGVIVFKLHKRAII